MESPPQDDEIVEIVNKREDELLLAGTMMFKNGDAHVSEQLPDIQ